MPKCNSFEQGNKQIKRNAIGTIIESVDTIWKRNMKSNRKKLELVEMDEKM